MKIYAVPRRPDSSGSCNGFHVSLRGCLFFTKRKHAVEYLRTNFKSRHSFFNIEDHLEYYVFEVDVLDCSYVSILKEQKRLREKAKSKLTKEEREALGI